MLKTRSLAEASWAGIFPKAIGNDAIRIRRHLHTGTDHLRCRIFQDRRHGLGRRLTSKSAFPGQYRIEQTTQREYIASCVSPAGRIPAPAPCARPSRAPY